MTDAHASEKGAAPTRAYAPRQTNAERAESRREAVLASVARPPDELRVRALRQAQAAEVERIEKTIAAMDDQTPDALRRAMTRQLAAIKEGQKAEDAEQVWVTVRTRGAGKISMGQHIAQVGDVHFDKGERLQLPIETAKKYDELGWVDIDGGD